MTYYSASPDFLGGLSFDHFLTLVSLLPIFFFNISLTFLKLFLLEHPSFAVALFGVIYTYKRTS